MLIKADSSTGCTKYNYKSSYNYTMPEFPGGDDAFLKFVKSNIRYPEIAKRAEVTGRVIVTCIIDTCGNISKIDVVKGIGAGCDEEAIRIMKASPRWKPATLNNKATATTIHAPIDFVLPPPDVKK
jgi:periplasmic protein TonB